MTGPVHRSLSLVSSGAPSKPGADRSDPFAAPRDPRMKWADDVAAMIQRIGPGPYFAHMHAYRVDGQACLVCEVSGEQRRSTTITFMLGQACDYDLSDPGVSDAVQAVEMMTMLATRLRAAVVLGRP